MNEGNISSSGRLSILEWALCVLLTSIVVVTFVQVISRYVLQTSLAWTEELARYMFIWLAALGAAYAFKTKAHFLLRFVVDKFSRKLQIGIATFVAALMAVFFIVFIWQAILYTQSVAGQIAPGTGLSKSVPASSAIVGGVLMLYYSMRNWADEIRAYRDGAASEGGRE